MFLLYLAYLLFSSCDNLTELDLSNFNVKSSANLTGMFSGTDATVGYAKTQAIADRFNDSSQTNIPSRLRFTTK